MPPSDLLELRVRVERYELEPLELDVSSGFTRRTTVVRLHGAGEEGVGEDVTYDGDEQLAFQAAGPVLELGGVHTLAGFSALLPADLHPYRRWAFESAALDLALRQAGQSLAEAVERAPLPLTFVVSTREGIARWRELYPGIRFKLDAEDAWDDAQIATLAATGAVETVDFKGHYRGTPVDLDPDPELYRRVAEGFPRAWLEDAWLDERTTPVLEPHRDRLTWDAPIHSVADVEALRFAPLALNVKPSRLGSLASLLELYHYAEERGIALYAGGQFELGPGRGQIQLLASLFHADAPNDCAPGVFNSGGPRAGLPVSPLRVRARPTGFSLL